MTIKELMNLRKYYPIKEELPQMDRNSDKPFLYISDKELIEKFNSNNYKLHPIYPLLINQDGTKIYDIRDGYKIIIKCPNDNRLFFRLLGYSTYLKVHKVVIEAWNNCIIPFNNEVHHIDFNKSNNHYTNLLIVNKKEHKLIHKKHDNET